MQAVTVLRLKPGETEMVRILSRCESRLRGFWTHWHMGRSRYCYPGCDGKIHEIEPVWKSYLCCQKLNRTQARWEARVLEVTEHLELCMRGEVQRGTVWIITKAKNDDKKQAKKEPVEGRLFAREDPSTWAPEFNMQPVLQTTFHYVTGPLEFTVINPTPDRVYIADEIDQFGGAGHAKPTEPPRVTLPEGGTLFPHLREKVADHFTEKK